ncbi:hypothetical protein PIB30_087825 [Stylosanthes scabra]|uniref:Uncharacterized protein n=1 Tax=Stylosanthes scabra TaxID=79078 RepID=A0ABU6VVE3_9FABA|nr:hypothetical protein [Stylosanthes scabra]
MNQERMRHDQILQEAAAQQAKEANKGKAREVVPDSEEEFVSSESEEWKNEERKLAEQETKLGSKTEQDSTHMRGRARICVLLIPQPTPK